tara:strand:- start:6374 stop:7279 length:906 start_codon:yes stop_codon:yes gene_type:complete
VFNRGDLLREVLSGLAQQDVPLESFEVLVCDDGSTESLNSVVSEFEGKLPNLRHLNQKNQGPAAARNFGITNSVSDVVLFVDSDVVLGPAVVSGLTEALETNPDWVGAEAKLEPVGGEDTLGWDAPRTDTGGHYHTAGIAYRRSILEAVGGMDENFSRAACEDVELAVQMLRHGEIGFVPTAIVYHPRRRRTASSCWKARKNWRYVQILACRYGFLSWPGNLTNSPRIRTAVAAAITLPIGRLRRAISFFGDAPVEALRGIGLSAIDWAAGLSMLPTIFMGNVPDRRSSVTKISAKDAESA